jgi:hypothetical protein
MTDSTTWWVFWQRHREHLGQILIGLLLFMAGWQVGRVMSPYYTSQPIVFEDRQCSACAGSGGSMAELEQLQQEGITARRPRVSPVVAAASDQQAQGEFVASVNSDLYHHVSCPSVSRIKPENQVWFASPEEAQASGYEPSQCTQERLGL